MKNSNEGKITKKETMWVVQVNKNKITTPRSASLVAIDKWCHEHCISEWRISKPDEVNINTVFTEVYRFQEVKDALYFKIIWG